MSYIIYYYQTFDGLNKLLSKDNIPVTHIHLSSIHFGRDYKNTPYIHLNDDPPDNYIYNSLWSELEQAVKRGIKVVLMVGGAGGAYDVLFSEYQTYKNLLFETIDKHRDIISGIDLDIEEFVDINNVIMLIKDIKKKYSSNFSISMAPVQESIENDCIGLGGFSYKQLYKSEVGDFIDYFCVQFYTNFGETSYDTCIENGYPPKKIVMGMLSGMNYDDNRVVVFNLAQKYKENFGGVFCWEYYNAPPRGSSDPSYWAYDMFNQINKKIILGGLFNYLFK